MSKKIFSIDDDHVFGLVVQRMFENNNPNHRVVTRTSLSDGLNYLKEISVYEYPDIILVDVNMPNGGAFQFLEQYKTFSQSFCHFFLHAKGFLQLLQILEGKFVFL